MSLKQYIKKSKLFCFAIAKRLFLYRAAMFMTRNRLRILCYHGFSSGDEQQWLNELIMHPDVLESRMSLLLNQGYNIISLSEAVERLSNKTLEPYSLVITIDDGFATTYRLAHPVFRKYNIPYTVYLTTYYQEKGIPVVNLYIDYCLWKTPRDGVSVKELGLEGPYSLSDKSGRHEFRALLLEAIGRIKDIGVKVAALKSFTLALGLNPEEELARDVLRLLTREQIRTMQDEGADFQLHTHRHRFPDDEQVIKEEVESNRRSIHALTGKEANHLCYPSGEHYISRLGTLRALSIASATTCTPGLVTSGDDLLLLNRYIDTNDKSQLEFEALVSGFKHLITFGHRVRF